MRLALLVAVTAFAAPALAQPGASSPPYGTPPAPPAGPTYEAPAPEPYRPAPPASAPRPEDPPPTYGAPPYAPPPAQPTYAPPPAQPTYAPPAPPARPPQGYAPQPYVPPQPQGYTPQPYAPQGYAPQPYGSPSYGASAQPLVQPAQPADIKPPKSESTATWLSIGVTALGLGAIYAGAENDNENLAWAGLATMVVGPSAGHLYAGETKHALKMSLLRAAGVVTFAYGVSQEVQYDCIDYCSENNDGETAMWVGGAVFIGAALYDFYDAGRAAKRFNDAQQRSIVVAPTVMPSSRGPSPGIALSGQF